MCLAEYSREAILQGPFRHQFNYQGPLGRKKGINRNGKLTYRMEVVKSIEECRIANFLLFNNVAYEYEYPYEVETVTDSYRQYKPDFTIRQGDQRIYLEHFGITRDGRVPDWFSGADGQSATEKYSAAMAWKKALHQHHGTTLLESFSYEMREGVDPDLHHPDEIQ